MNDRLVSKYKNNQIASKKKHIFSRLLDYFSLFVVTYLLFTVFYSIANRLPVLEGPSRRLQEQNTQIAEYIDSTHLQRLNADHSALLSIDEGAQRYVEYICKTSAFVHEMAFPYKNESGVFEDKNINIEETFIYNAYSYELDEISYYYKIFKKNEPSLNNYSFNEIDYQDDIDTFLYLKIMGVDSTKFVNEDDSDYLENGQSVSIYTVLTKERTIELLRYFKEDRADLTLYNEIYLNFINAAKYGINDVENNSLPYRELISNFDNTYQSLITTVVIIYLLSYSVSYILLTLIMRLISKEWVTLGQKVLNLAISSYDELTPSIWQILVYYLLNYILFVTSLIIAFYFMGMIGVFSLKIIGPITLLSVLVALLIINIVSLLLPLFNKNNHDLTSLITRLMVKDTKEYEGPVMEEATNSDEESEHHGIDQ